MSDAAGIDLTKLEEPATHGFVGNIQSAFGQKLLDVTKAEREAGIHPDRHLDNGRWKTVTTIGVLVHATIRTTHLSARQRDKASGDEGIPEDSEYHSEWIFEIGRRIWGAA